MIVLGMLSALQGLGNGNASGWGSMSSKATTAMAGAAS
jgi:hypothetical protein